MLWDIIRDFFVQYIWGGTTSLGSTYYISIGELFDTTNANYVQVLSSSSCQAYLPINLVSDANDGVYQYINFGDWLSTTSTIIVLLGICIFLYLVTKYLFKFVAGLFKW